MHGDGNVENEGICPKVLRCIFDKIQNQDNKNYSTAIVFEMVEIYNNKIKDLFDEDTEKKTKVVENKNGEIHIHNIRQEYPEDLESAFRVYSEGLKLRKTSATVKNDTSSRSHLIMTICI